METSYVLDKPIVLSLNRLWQRIGTKSVRQAILAMNSTGDGDEMAAHGMNIEYEQDLDGRYDFSKPSNIYPVKWEDWLKLPIRPYDLVIGTAKGLVRVPTVVIATKCAIMPKKTRRLSKESIYYRDGGRCQYTGRQLTLKEATLDHVQPRSKNGKDTWENLVTCAPDVNFAKGNKSNEEMGYKLIKTPKAPMSMPASAFITECRHRDWAHFMD